jgi:DNA-binding response OmpR family regulator
MALKPYNGGDMSQGTPRGAEGRYPRRRILVADDDVHIARLIQVCLERHGCEVTKAYDGVEALIRALNQKFDLVVLDVMMPGLDGIDVLKAIRKDPSTEHVPVAIVTAKSQDSDIFEGYHNGADVYLTKPFNPRDLLAFLR